MITIKWSHIIIGLALVIGLLIGSHVQFAPSTAMAQTSSSTIHSYATDSSYPPLPPVALQVYNNNVYVVRGNQLFIFKTVESPYFKDSKIPILVGRAQIEMDTTIANSAVPLKPLPRQEQPLNRR